MSRLTGLWVEWSLVPKKSLPPRDMLSLSAVSHTHVLLMSKVFPVIHVCGGAE